MKQQPQAMQRIDAAVALGRVVGMLRADQAQQNVAPLIDVLIEAPRHVASDPGCVRVHADQRPHLDAAECAAQRQHELERIRNRTAKRYVLRIESDAGPRIVKISEPTTAGNLTLGMFSSVSRREHHNHLRAAQLGIAAAGAVGYLEWRTGLRLRRAAHIQLEIGPGLESIETHLLRELGREGDAAVERFGAALAASHGLPFFHGDLKGFHAYVDTTALADDEQYRLRWLDLARVSFAITRRKRVINLYQALRFVVPPREQAQKRFVAAYCRRSGWYANDPRRALSMVLSLLRRKYRTHPVVE